MNYIGISRGGTGTIGIINENDEPYISQVPWSWFRVGGHKHLNYKKFVELLKPYVPVQENEVRQKINAMAVVEKPIGFMWKKSASINIQKFIASNRFFEAEMGILEALGIPVTLVEPANWQRDMFTNKYHKMTEKQASLELGNDLFPELKQSKAKDRDGICMAYWLKHQKLFNRK